MKCLLLLLLRFLFLFFLASEKCSKSNKNCAREQKCAFVALQGLPISCFQKRRKMALRAVYLVIHQSFCQSSYEVKRFQHHLLAAIKNYRLGGPIELPCLPCMAVCGLYGLYGLMWPCMVLILLFTAMTSLELAWPCVSQYALLWPCIAFLWP